MPRPLTALALLLPAVLGACSLPAQRADFDSVDPQERTLAVAQAARTPRQADLPRLVTQLNSEDPAIRLLAIRTLERETGETFGYDHAAPEAARRQSVGRWVAWLNKQKPYNTDPAPGIGDM
jgi:hypothetical protein